MKWTELLASMDDEAFNWLRTDVAIEADTRDKTKAKTLPPPTPEEKLLHKTSLITAIKAYRARTGCSLGIARSKFCE